MRGWGGRVTDRGILKVKKTLGVMQPKIGRKGSVHVCKKRAEVCVFGWRREKPKRTV